MDTWQTFMDEAHGSLAMLCGGRTAKEVGFP